MKDVKSDKSNKQITTSEQVSERVEDGVRKISIKTAVRAAWEGHNRYAGPSPSP